MMFDWPWQKDRVGVLMVCRANVCRSPMAEALLQHRLQEAGASQAVEVRSAGTHVSARGMPRDQRVRAVLAERGVRMKRGAARRVQAADFERQDFLLAMDRSILETLLETCPAPHKHKLHLVTEYSLRHHMEEVPDPYYGNVAGFERVLELLDDSMNGLLEALLPG